MGYAPIFETPSPVDSLSMLARLVDRGRGEQPGGIELAHGEAFEPRLAPTTRSSGAGCD